MINSQLSYVSILAGMQGKDDIFSYINKKAAIPAKSVHQSMASEQLKQREEIAESSRIQRQMKSFAEAVNKAGSLEEALADPTVHKVMSAIYEVDILHQAPKQFAHILSTDPDSASSLLGRTRDQGLIAMGKDFKAAGDPLALMRDADYQEAIQNTLVSLEFEETAARTSQAASDAFYFERKATDIGGPMDILANSRLRDVVYGALGFSDHDKSRPIAEQAAKLAAAIDFTALEDPAYVRELAVNYLNSNDRQQGPGNSALAILGGSAGGGLVDILS